MRINRTIRILIINDKTKVEEFQYLASLVGLGKPKKPFPADAYLKM